jgi:HD-GYP domain-containing protein (c-di-GMP phosphodiesterase class II)
MRFQTRAFLISFIPVAILLTASFWMIQRFVQSTVRDGLRTSLSENQRAIDRVRSKSDLQNSRFLKVVGENASLKAGIQLLSSESGSQSARRTVEDQLRELGEHMGFDFLLVSAPDGTLLAGVVREPVAKAGGKGQLVPMDTASLELSEGLLLIGGSVFQVASVAIDQNEENIGALSVGQYFDFSEFTTPAMLSHNGKVIQSNIPRVSPREIDAALSRCPVKSECDVRLGGVNWMALPMQSASLGSGYLLRSFENLDSAIVPIQATLRNLFLAVAVGTVVVVFMCSVASSRSIVKPIAIVVSHLRNAMRTGILPEFEGDLSQIVEIKELTESYNRAAASVRKAGESLQGAYVEFVGSLASALDARDQYTSGHSRRVSQLARATAAEMGLGPDQVERIRIGALLHDIGKIGIVDSVLQKPGRLTDEELAIVKKHPLIGRRILEGVQGLAPFLDAVELHHENWNGTGYPKGYSGEETPVDARIIHVSDAYDAMTTDRSYRRGMSREQAIHILCEYSGTQFDPVIVELFAKLPHKTIAEHCRLSEDPERVGDLEVVEAG